MKTNADKKLIKAIMIATTSILIFGVMGVAVDRMVEKSGTLIQAGINIKSSKIKDLFIENQELRTVKEDMEKGRAVDKEENAILKEKLSHKERILNEKIKEIENILQHEKAKNKTTIDSIINSFKFKKSVLEER